MLPQNQHMIYKIMKEVVPAEHSSDMFSLSRFVDYIAIVADQHNCQELDSSGLLGVSKIVVL